jgi:parallel beta-helix repeat protein
MFTSFAATIGTIKAQDGGSSPLSGPIELTSDYTLTEDLTFDPGHGFIIKADGITLDGAGYKITGSKSIATCEWISATDPNEANSAMGVLNSGYDNVVIKNLEIENFATGIYLHGIASNHVENNLIEDCVIHDNGLDDMGGSGSESVTHGIHTCYVRDSEITDNEIYDNEGTGSGCEDGGNGIYMHGGGSDHDYNTISGNDLYDNAKSGFWMKRGSDYCTISNNHAWENGNGAGITDDTRGGIILRCKTTDHNQIELNTVENNNGEGIYIGGYENIIEENIITGNSKNGIFLGRSDGSEDNQILNNYICGHSSGYFDVNNFHSSGGGNTGDDNAGETAKNYRDDGTTGSEYFTYPCIPDTTITSGPSGTIDYNDVTFTWTGEGYITSSTGLKYSYKLEGYDPSWSSYTTSTSKSYNDLDDGSYTFKVKAKDAAGNVDPSPAQRSFTVDTDDPDTTPPDTSITSGPSGTIDYDDVSFTWTGSDDTTPTPDLTYSFKLEGYDSDWSSYSSSTSKNYNDLGDDSYIFKVKAKDMAGNIDPTPAERLFNVEAEGEEVEYDVSWKVLKKQIPIENPLLAKKKGLIIEFIQEIPFINIQLNRQPFEKIIKIDEYNIKSINFTLSWKDDKIENGEDTLTLTINSPNGNELYKQSSTGEGILNYKKTDINPLPDVNSIIGKNEDDALENLKEYYGTNWKNENIKITVSVEIGEKRFLRRLFEKGNDFTLGISYEYYAAEVTIADDPPETQITSEIIDKNKIQIKWQGQDDKTPYDELRYSYLLKNKSLETDPAWSDWTKKTSISYDNLANGNYLFKVKTKDNTGNIDLTPAEQVFKIKYISESDYQKNNDSDNIEKNSSVSSESNNLLNLFLAFISIIIFAFITLINKIKKD